MGRQVSICNKISCFKIIKKTYQALSNYNLMLKLLSQSFTCNKAYYTRYSTKLDGVLSTIDNIARIMFTHKTINLDCWTGTKTIAGNLQRKQTNYELVFV